MKAKDCIYFKPQAADHKHHGCVQSEPCEQCEGCAYVAPGGVPAAAPVESKKKKK